MDMCIYLRAGLVRRVQLRCEARHCMGGVLFATLYCLSLLYTTHVQAEPEPDPVEALCLQFLSLDWPAVTNRLAEAKREGASWEVKDWDCAVSRWRRLLQNRYGRISMALLVIDIDDYLGYTRGAELHRRIRCLWRFHTIHRPDPWRDVPSAWGFIQSRE